MKYLKYTKPVKYIQYIVVVIAISATAIWGYNVFLKYKLENQILKEVVERLQAESMVAEVLVTGVNYDEKKQKTYTTIKFLEYDNKRQALSPKYFTFSGNIIQFQSLVIRFDDIHVRKANRFKGKSAFIFWKAFMLDGEDTQEFEINKINAIPSGYKVEGLEHPFEQQLWEDFWEYGLNPEQAEHGGIKSAQIEAPGSIFVPGIIYRIYIEHDGGLRINTEPLAEILKGETIPE